MMGFSMVNAMIWVSSELNEMYSMHFVDQSAIKMNEFVPSLATASPPDLEGALRRALTNIILITEFIHKLLKIIRLLQLW